MLESERQDTVNELVIYGLTPVQAETFVTLTKLGRSSAKAISNNCDINRVDVYRALKRLNKLGVVEESLGNPTEFTAVEPFQALEILVGQKLRQVDKLQNMKQELGSKLSLLMQYSAGEENTRAGSVEGPLFLKVLSGEQAFRKLKILEINSRSEIVKAISSRSTTNYQSIGMMEQEAELIETRNIHIRAVTRITRDNMAHAKEYSQVVNLRHNENLDSRLRYTIVDKSVLLLSVGEPPQDISQGTALWTNSKALLSGLIEDFEKLWANSVTAESRFA